MTKTVNTYEMACSVISDCCEFNKHFIGVDCNDKAIVNLIDESCRYIEFTMTDLELTKTEWNALYAEIRLEVMAQCLSCAPENAERLYNHRKAS